MIFRRRKRAADTDGEPDDGASGTAVEPGEESEEPAATDAAPALEDLDDQDWRADGPWDVTEVDLDDDAPEDRPRIDLGSVILTGFPGAEVRLQVTEGSQQIISAMLIHGDSALEIGAYAAPRSGGLWPELRAELIESATEAGGSASVAEGPFGVELRRLLPVQTPDGGQGYQPSRMWVVEGPRWMLRGIVYGQAALEEGDGPPAAELLEAFRSIIVRRDDQAMAPGDLLPLHLPHGVQPADPGRD